MNYLVILVMLFVASCGKEDKTKDIPPPDFAPPPVTKVDDAVSKYYEEFKKDCEDRKDTGCLTIIAKGQLESVKVVDAATLRKDPGSENRVGVCYTWTKAGKFSRAQVEILENDGYGNAWDPDALKGLVYHELGHCLLGLEHTCDPKVSQCVNNYSDPHMMWPSMYSASTYRKYWTQMVNEMFTLVGRWLASPIVSADIEPGLIKHIRE